MKKAIYLFAFAILIAACKKDERPKTIVKEDLPTVKTQEVDYKSLSENIEGSGILANKAEIKLAFKMGGLIKKVYVAEGQSVKAGQLLAELDMSEIDAQVNQTKLGLQKAQRDLERIKKLYDDEVATKTNLDDAATAVDLASQTVRTASFNQKLSKIYAPKTGKILRKISEQGELITPFAPAFILGTGGSEFVLNIGLADRDIVKINIGQVAEVSLDAYPGEKFKARVSQIAQTINPATGTYETELTLDSKGKKLISGFIAKASISQGKSENLLAVPLVSIVEADQNQGFVFVLEGKKVKRKSVGIGKIFRDYVQITGLQKGDKVVSDGANFLSDGQSVNLN